MSASSTYYSFLEGSADDAGSGPAPSSSSSSILPSSTMLLQEMNFLSKEFEARRKMYQDPDLFFASSPAAAAPVSSDGAPEDDEDPESVEIRRVQGAIEEGRRMFLEHFKTYSECKNKVEEIKIKKKQILENFKTAIQMISLINHSHASLFAEDPTEETNTFETCQRSLEDAMAVVARRLDDQVLELDGTLKKETKSIRKLATVYKTLRSTGTGLCPVCLANEVDSYAAPCGHTFCKNCLPKITLQKCYMCRRKVESVSQLYFN